MHTVGLCTAAVAAAAEIKEPPSYADGT